MLIGCDIRGKNSCGIRQTYQLFGYLLTDQKE
jgi:hypothetical protein